MVPVSNEKQFIRNPEYAKNINILSDCEEKLTLLLTGKEKQLFLDFLNAESSVNAISDIENFITGFKLGVKIGIEVMDGEDSVLMDIT